MIQAPPPATDPPSPSPRPASPRPAATVFVLVTVFLDTLGLGLIIPVGPRLVASFLADDLSRAATCLGVLISLYAGMQFVAAPILGGLSDHFGRRPVILLSLLGAAASYLLTGFAPSLAWIFIGRTIAGITGASFAAAGAYVADVTAPEARAQSFGLVGAAFGLGIILGPAVGGALGEVGIRMPYFVAAGLNLVNLLYGLFILPESLPRSARRPFSLARANPVGALRALARHPVTLGLTGTMTCGFMAQWIAQSVWALDTQARFGWSLRDVGLSLMLVGVGTALVQGALVRVIVPRLGERKALVLGLASSVIAQVAFGLAYRSWMMLASIAFAALGGVAGPAVQASISRAVGPSEQGEVQGALNSLNGLTAIVGPMIGTTLLATFGAPSSAVRVPGAAFFASAAFTALGLGLALRMFARSDAAEKMPSRDVVLDG